MSPILHITTKQLSPTLLETHRYVPSEDIFCEADDVDLHTSSYEQDGWSTLENLGEALSKLDYKDYKVCEKCMENPVVALFLLAELP